MALTLCRTGGMMIMSPAEPFPHIVAGDELELTRQHLQSRLAGAVVLAEFVAGEQRDDGLPQVLGMPTENRLGAASAAGRRCEFELLPCQGGQRELVHVPQYRSDAAARTQLRAYRIQRNLIPLVDVIHSPGSATHSVPMGGAVASPATSRSTSVTSSCVANGIACA